MGRSDTGRGCSGGKGQEVANGADPLFLRSIPPNGRELVVYTLRGQHLMDINDSIMEGCRAGGQIQMPHAYKFFIKHASDRIQMLQ